MSYLAGNIVTNPSM